jgi:shikimate kinase
MSMTPASKNLGGDQSHPVVALTGFMGSGKSSTGQELATLLGWMFVDLDSEIETRQGMAVRELFRERGEAGFREIEHEVLRDFLARRSHPTVVALGGGAFVQPDNAALLEAHHVVTVFLETDVEEMRQRCGVEDEADPENMRPLAADAQGFRALYEKRLPFYRRANTTIQTAGKSAVGIAREIVTVLGLKAVGGE